MTDAGFDLALADPRQAGVFFVGEDDLPTLAAAALAAALPVVRIDLRGCTGKDALLQRLAEALATPAGQGRYWDALAYQLRDLSWRPAPGHVLLFSAADALRDADEACFDTLLDILDEATVDWQAQDVPFWAFLALPEDDFPEEGTPD